MDAYIEVAKQGKIQAYFGSVQRPDEVKQHAGWFDKNVASMLGGPVEKPSAPPVSERGVTQAAGLEKPTRISLAGLSDEEKSAKLSSWSTRATRDSRTSRTPKATTRLLPASLARMAGISIIVVAAARLANLTIRSLPVRHGRKARLPSSVKRADKRASRSRIRMPRCRLLPLMAVCRSHKAKTGTATDAGPSFPRRAPAGRETLRVDATSGNVYAGAGPTNVFGVHADAIEAAAKTIPIVRSAKSFAMLIPMAIRTARTTKP